MRRRSIGPAADRPGDRAHEAAWPVSSPSGPSRGARSRLLAGADRDAVDARLGDLEVSLRAAGHPTRPVRRSRGAGHRAGGRGAHRPLRRDGRDPAVAGVPGDPGDRRLPPAGHRAAVERVRGVDSDYSLRSLQHRRLVVELGRADAPGRPILYGTGFDFLERFGLTSLDDLPPLDPDVAARLALEGSAGRERRRPDGDVRGDETDGPAQAAFGLEGTHVPEERLQKVLAAAGVASRRASETLIAAGRVRVDGRVARLGEQVDRREGAYRGGRHPGGRRRRACLRRAPQAGRRDLDDPRPPRRHDRPGPPARPPSCRTGPGSIPLGGSTGTARACSS